MHVFRADGARLAAGRLRSAFDLPFVWKFSESCELFLIEKYVGFD